MSNSHDKKVNLFIIGAPKAGTTSLYYYLNQHPDIQMSRVKEPHYFSSDFPDYSNINTIEEYHSLFNWEEDVPYYGDASVWHLYSQEAIDNILAYNPDAKFIVMLRNPAELLPSLHNQLKLTLMEDIEDFEDAWDAIEERKAGRMIPKFCREPKMLYYDEVAKFGEQMERLISKIDTNNLLVVQFEDFKVDSKKIVKDTLRFMGLSSEVDKIDFDVKNERSEIRSPFLNRLVFSLSKNLSPIIKKTKSLLGVEQFGILDQVKERNKKKTEKQEVNPKQKKKIEASMREDQRKLEKVLKLFV